MFEASSGRLEHLASEKGTLAFPPNTTKNTTKNSFIYLFKSRNESRPSIPKGYVAKQR